MEITFVAVGREHIGATTKAAHDYMMQEVDVKEAGYAYIYVSNENATLVEFYVDDVVITHTPSNIIQYNEYYPFGMQTANSWTRENTTGNSFLYNEGSELNTTSGYYDLPYRTYDPVLGRMNGVDPLASKYASLTPYNYSNNDPVFYTDPSGAEYGVPEWMRERVDQLPHIDGGGGSDYSNQSFSGISILENPGFINAGLWNAISNAWYSVGYNQIGSWSFLKGDVISGGIVDVGSRSIVSWVGGMPGDYNTAASIVMLEAITSGSRNGGLKHMQASSTSQVIQLLSKELGITSNEIFLNSVMLENVDVYD